MPVIGTTLLTYAVAKAALVTQKLLPTEILIELTNPFTPLATTIDDTCLEGHFNEAIRRFNELTYSDAYADFAHDLSAVLHLMISYLWKFNEKERQYWFSAAKAICENIKRYKLAENAETDENSAQEYTPDVNSTRFPKRGFGPKTQNFS